MSADKQPHICLSPSQVSERVILCGEPQRSIGLPRCWTMAGCWQRTASFAAWTDFTKAYLSLFAAQA